MNLASKKKYKTETRETENVEDAAKTDNQQSEPEFEPKFKVGDNVFIYFMDIEPGKVTSVRYDKDIGYVYEIQKENGVIFEQPEREVHYDERPREIVKQNQEKETPKGMTEPAFEVGEQVRPAWGIGQFMAGEVLKAEYLPDMQSYVYSLKMENGEIRRVGEEFLDSERTAEKDTKTEEQQKTIIPPYKIGEVVQLDDSKEGIIRGSRYNSSLGDYIFEVAEVSAQSFEEAYRGIRRINSDSPIQILTGTALKDRDRRSEEITEVQALGMPQYRNGERLQWMADNGEHFTGIVRNVLNLEEGKYGYRIEIDADENGEYRIGMDCDYNGCFNIKEDFMKDIYEKLIPDEYAKYKIGDKVKTGQVIGIHCIENMGYVYEIQNEKGIITEKTEASLRENEKRQNEQSTTDREQPQPIQESATHEYTPTQALHSSEIIEESARNSEQGLTFEEQSLEEQLQEVMKQVPIQKKDEATSAISRFLNKIKERFNQNEHEGENR